MRKVNLEAVFVNKSWSDLLSCWKFCSSFWEGHKICKISTVDKSTLEISQKQLWPSQNISSHISPLLLIDFCATTFQRGDIFCIKTLSDYLNNLDGALWIWFRFKEKKLFCLFFMHDRDSKLKSTIQVNLSGNLTTYSI